jgi:MT0933-like antitoxin protein
MALIRRLATLATAAEAARRYARKNPQQAAKYVDQAVQFVDKQTKGKYTSHVHGVANKVRGVAGLPTNRGHQANAGFGQHAGYGQPLTPSPTTPTVGSPTVSGTGTGAPPSTGPVAGEPYPGSPNTRP